MVEPSAFPGMEFVRWIDSYSISDAQWFPVGELDQKMESVYVHTLGYVAKEDDECVVLAQGYSLGRDGEPVEWGHVWVIPKVSIVRRVRVAAA